MTEEAEQEAAANLFPVRLLRARRVREMTQRQLADKAGLPLLRQPDQAGRCPWHDDRLPAGSGDGALRCRAGDGFPVPGPQPRFRVRSPALPRGRLCPEVGGKNIRVAAVRGRAPRR
jgi:hypothetical protein